jgi:hypothetical protein
MKKTLAIIFFCLPFCAFSQDTLSKWSWGLTGGVVWASIEGVKQQSGCD